MIVSLVDKQFRGNSTAANGVLKVKTALKFNRDNKNSIIKFFTDTSLNEAINDLTPVKIAWLLESPDLFEDVYDQIKDIRLQKYFSYIFTHNKQLLKQSEKFIFCPFGGTWIPKEKWLIYPKNRMISIVASSKHELEGHKLRHSVIREYGSQINAIMGTGYKPFEHKLDSVQDFRYSIVIENCREDYFFTEKIIDCFATGTVPIYWGCPSISDFFNIDGIIPFSRLEDINSILKKISIADYQSRLAAIKDNYERAKNYSVTEDYIAAKILPTLSLRKKTNTKEAR